MKRLLFTAILLAGMGIGAFAQEHGGKNNKTPEEKAKHATEMLTKKLSLTDEQQSKVYAINLESFKKWKEDREESGKKNKAARQSSMEERDQKLNEVLNESQRKSYSEMKEKRAEKMKEHHLHKFEKTAEPKSSK